MRNIFRVAELYKDEDSLKGFMAKYILSIKDELTHIPDKHKGTYIVEKLKRSTFELSDRLRNANAWSAFLNELIEDSKREK